jgi:signal transduction histidine kinase
VQFYEDDDALCDTVGHYVGAGLAAGEKVVVIATEPHRRALALRLKGNAFDLQRAGESGQLTLLDARETMDKFMIGGLPDSKLFAQAVCGVFDGSGAAHVHAYGEMVDVLWRDGNPVAAVRLEDLWNDLGRQRSFSLLCAYGLRNFEGETDRGRFEEVCRVHTHVFPAPGSSLPNHVDAIGFLQRRTRALENEIRHRKHLEGQLREALETRERLLLEVRADRARIHASEEQEVVQRKRLELLQSITASFSRALKPRDIAEIIVRDAAAALGAPTGGIWLLDEDERTLELTHASGFSAKALEGCSRLGIASPMPIARSHVARAEVWIESLDAYEATYPEAAAHSRESGEGAIACLPLTVEERSFGAFSIAFPGARTFTADERRFLRTLSRHAAQALDRARLFEEAKRVEVSLRFLSEASNVLAGSLDYDATLAAVARLAVPRIADWTSIDMLNPDGTLRRVALAHIDPEKVALGWELSHRHPPGPNDPRGPGCVVRTGQSEVFADVSDDMLARAVPDTSSLRIVRSLGPVSWMCVPLHECGRPAGAMTLVSAESHRHFGGSDLALAEELARRASMAIDNAKAYREAQEANRVKDDFLATMSHELRTPLNAILGWSAMLRSRPDVDVRKGLETIERNARAQVRLIEEVLDISRIMTGKLKLDSKSIDLAALVRASIDVVAPSALAKAIALDSRLPGEPCPFYGDAGRLQQVFWNLLSNAVKFTSKGGLIEVSLTQSRSEVEFIVKDTGRGIRSDFLPVMFQRFRQADSSTTRTESGLGIGLAVVSHVVELHGGTVKAASAGEGRGATFTVTLPVRAVSMVETQPALVSAVAGRPLAGLRVLVCEDDPDSRELLRVVLAREGATVRLAAAASEAIDHIRDFRPDVFLSDIGLPLVDGYALIRQIRTLAEDEGGRTPSIALTAYAGCDDARKACAEGYQLHMAKPVHPTELIAQVANLAGRHS